MAGSGHLTYLFKNYFSSPHQIGAFRGYIFEVIYIYIHIYVYISEMPIGYSRQPVNNQP